MTAAPALPAQQIATARPVRSGGAPSRPPHRAALPRRGRASTPCSRNCRRRAALWARPPPRLGRRRRKRRRAVCATRARSRCGRGTCSRWICFSRSMRGSRPARCRRPVFRGRRAPSPRRTAQPRSTAPSRQSCRSTWAGAQPNAVPGGPVRRTRPGERFGPRTPARRAGRPAAGARRLARRHGADGPALCAHPCVGATGPAGHSRNVRGRRVQPGRFARPWRSGEQPAESPVFASASASFADQLAAAAKPAGPAATPPPALPAPTSLHCRTALRPPPMPKPPSRASRARLGCVRTAIGSRPAHGAARHAAA